MGLPATFVKLSTQLEHTTTRDPSQSRVGDQA